MSGITFCAGSQTVDDRRVNSGLVLAIGSIGCIIDNTKGTVVTFGDFHFYVAIAAKDVTAQIWYPKIWAKVSLFIFIASWHTYLNC